MRAMILTAVGRPLESVEMPMPSAGAGELLVRVTACAVCRTDLHVVDGELPHSKLPLIIGHEIVGRIGKVGIGVENFRVGERVGIPWLGWTCGECRFCRTARENLCAQARFSSGQYRSSGRLDLRTFQHIFGQANSPEPLDLRATPPNEAKVTIWLPFISRQNTHGVYNFDWPL